MTFQPEDWWKTTFDEEFAGIMQKFKTREITLKEAEFLERALELKAGERVLDLACGYGRHAIELAKRGYCILGLDISRPMLELAQKSSDKSGAQFILGDMRSIPLSDSCMDSAYSFYTSFGYFCDGENSRVIHEVSRVLSPDGRFLIDLKNCGNKNSLNPQAIYRMDDAIIEERRELDRITRRINTQITVTYFDGRISTKKFSIRVYTLKEMEKILLDSGLVITSKFGDISGIPYGPDSKRMIIIARKITEY